MEIGTQRTDDIRLGVKTKFYYHKNSKPDKNTAIFGIPLKFSDSKEYEVHFEHKWLPIGVNTSSEQFIDNTDTVMNVELDFDFNVNMYIYVYYSILDITS